MTKYSHFFKTIYDEPKPVGSLGRGTHYSILRAVIFKDNSKAYFHDFAIIWDEDHDDKRMITILEQLYYSGLLPHFIMIGERKGEVYIISESRNKNIESTISSKIREISEPLIGDYWEPHTGNIADQDHAGIISDSEDKVKLYLNNINMLWSLGSKSINDF
jgi:hypothetical protein